MLPDSAWGGTLTAQRDFGSSVTQQYIVGQFSVLLEDLQPPSGEWLSAVRDLRREVESCPLPMLPRLAQQAIGLTDLICWSALEQGDINRFCGCARSAAALGEFIDNARLLQGLARPGRCSIGDGGLTVAV